MTVDEIKNWFANNDMVECSGAMMLALYIEACKPENMDTGRKGDRQLAVGHLAEIDPQ